jgi:hypothetical protein
MLPWGGRFWALQVGVLEAEYHNGQCKVNEKHCSEYNHYYACNPFPVTHARDFDKDAGIFAPVSMKVKCLFRG